MTAIPNGDKIINNVIIRGLKPDPLMTVSQWADESRYLSARASAEPGRWRTSRTPYLKEIMDCLSPFSPEQEVVFVAGAQLGKTEAGSNWMGFIIDHAPGPTLLVQPTVEMAKRTSKQRIDPLIEESPSIRKKVQPARARDSGNTVLSKEFPGGILILTGANSAVGLRSMPAKNLFLDEIDAFPGDVDGEGDPVNLAVRRTSTFSRRKVFKTSTPTIEGRSRIVGDYLKSDQRRYFVPCPHCKHMQWLKWSNIRWEEGHPETVYYVCEDCGGVINEHHKTDMLARGEWRSTATAKVPHVAGFHISSLYSPLGWFGWVDAVRMWEDAQGNQSKLRVFVNTILGETWKEKGDSPEWERIYRRRESYKANTIPEGVCVLTAGVDVQKDRLELEIVGFGRNMESWSIDYRVLNGDTSSLDVWDALQGVLNEQWQTATGGFLNISMMAVDSGYNTQMVYNWVRQQPLNRVMAIKGNENLNLTIGQPKIVDVTLKGKKIKRGAKVWPVGVSTAKAELYSWLKQEPPVNDEDPLPYGYCHFPQYGEEYFKQMTAEQIVVRIIRGFHKYQWEKTRERNEALDCRVYARAAASAVGVDRFTDTDWSKAEKHFTKKASQQLPVDQKSDGQKHNKKRQRRKSTWL